MLADTSIKMQIVPICVSNKKKRLPDRRYQPNISRGAHFEQKTMHSFQ